MHFHTWRFYVLDEGVGRWIIFRYMKSLAGGYVFRSIITIHCSLDLGVRKSSLRRTSIYGRGFSIGARHYCLQAG